MPSNALLTRQEITREALVVLHQKLNFIPTTNHQYDDSFADKEAKIGDSLRIRMPNEYTVRTGRNLTVQDTVEQNIVLQINTQKGVDVSFTSADLTLSLQDFSERILEPAMAVLAAAMEADALTMALDVPYLVGTPGSLPNSLKLFLQAQQKMTENLAPPGQRSFHIEPAVTPEIIDALKGLFQDSEAIKKQYREGKMGRTAGGTWYENTLMPRHTLGTQTTSGAMQVDGATQTGSTLTIKGTTNTATLTKGTVFTINNVFQVHPETKQATTRLQQFVVTANKTFSGTSGQTIEIFPAIVTSGGRQNVVGSPADSAAITAVGTAGTGYTQNLLHHRDAFAFASCDLVVPRGVDMAHREVYDGISMRLVRQYDISDDTFPCRFDVMYGWKTLRPPLACRITS